MFVLRRLAAVVLVAVGAATAVFLTLHGLFPETFNDTHPLFVELWLFLERTFVHFDLGQSRFPPFRDVTGILGQGLEADASVIVGGLGLGFLLGTGAGAVAARRPRSVLARAMDVGALLALCTPVYVMAMAAIFLFAPSIGAPVPIFFADPSKYVAIQDNPLEWFRSLIVPWIVLALPLAAINMRLTRADLRELLREDFVRTAAAKGLPPWVVATRHMLPVAMPPAISLTGAYVPLLVGNVLLVEAVYGIPGSFRFLPRAISFGDYPVIQGLVLISAFFVVVCNGVADVLLATLDPRVREKGY
jgi:peptide/nickel transport system permease protein